MTHLRVLGAGDHDTWVIRTADVKSAVAIIEIGSVGSVFLHVDQDGGIYLTVAAMTAAPASELDMTQVGMYDEHGIHLEVPKQVLRSLAPVIPFPTHREESP